MKKTAILFVLILSFSLLFSCVGKEEKIEEVILEVGTYKMEGTETIRPPSVCLEEDGTFTFTLSVISDYIPSGNYTIKDSKLYLEAGKEEVFVFDIKDSKLILDKENSAYIPVIEGDTPIENGNVFSIEETERLKEFDDMVFTAKPVIYLYPEKKTNVDINLDYSGEFTFTYPGYNNGWNVTAYPDGKIIDNRDGAEYSYIFWEGNANMKYDMSKGLVVKGKDTVEFLKEKLNFLGLLPKEYNEFIVYWAPKMIDNKYNLITFQDKEYIDNAKLSIDPEPDSIQRVFMVYTPLEEKIAIEEQELTPFKRTGFTVIEWGGSIVAD